MMNLNQILDAADSAIEAKKEEIIALGQWFWKNPESGYKEFKTSEHAIKKLREIGLCVNEHLAITGFRADIDTGKPGPTIAILGELDSLILPNHSDADKQTGAVHACGHNAQIAALIGTAIGLLAVKDFLCGKIALIACPAEEGIELDFRKSLIDAGKIGSLAGKSQLIREGVFDDVDIAYMNHLSDQYGYFDHNGCVNKRITFHGLSCHAASPQYGVNALNASNLALHAIALMRESLCDDDKIRIHGIITNGGTAVNILPNKVTMEYMLRAPSIDAIRKISDRFDHVVQHAAKAAECTADIETVNGYMPLIDCKPLGAVMENVVKRLVPNVKYEANTQFYRSCTDMGDVGTVIPAIHGYVPGESGMAHGTDYRIANPYTAYVLNAKIQALTAIELLYGTAEKGRVIAAIKKDMMPIEDYIKFIDGLCKTVC